MMDGNGPFEMVMITGMVWTLYGDFGLTTDGSISEKSPQGSRRLHHRRV